MINKLLINKTIILFSIHFVEKSNLIGGKYIRFTQGVKLIIDIY